VDLRARVRREGDEATMHRECERERERERDREVKSNNNNKVRVWSLLLLDGVLTFIVVVVVVVAFLLFLGFSCRRTMQRLLLSYCVWHGYIDTAQLILNHMKADGCDDGDQGELHDIKLPTAEQQQERLGMWHLASTTHYIASHRIASHHHCTWSTCLL
jgi:hypothetical protein